MKRVQRGRSAASTFDSLAQVWGRRAVPASTLCSLTQTIARIEMFERPHDLPGHKLEPVKSPLYPSTPRCAKRTHVANQMKRVQRVEDSLAQSGARSPSVLPAESISKPICLRKSAPTPRRRLRNSASPFPVVTPSESPKETCKPKVNWQNSITTPTHENARVAIPTHAEQERDTAQDDLFGAMRQTAGVNRT